MATFNGYVSHYQKVVGSFFCICSWLSPLESSGFPPASFVRQSPQGERIPLVTGPIQMLMTGGAMGCLIVVLPPWYDMMQSHTFVYIYIYIYIYIHTYIYTLISLEVYWRRCAGNMCDHARALVCFDFCHGPFRSRTCILVPLYDGQ